MTNLLPQINTPHDLKALSMPQLIALAQELRAFLIQSVSTTGGHLSSNLGTVELAIALHYVFNCPTDCLVWDVGHQSYPHKILTGRRDAMATLRQFGGLSGFPKRTESEYDDFGTAHSSTSISAALGMAVAARQLGLSDRQHIAVIGDGAMTAGMAFEALNNAGVTPDVNLLVILNDNDMSISAPVGALNKYLSRLHRVVYDAQDLGKNILQQLPMGNAMITVAKRMRGYAKNLVIEKASLFEELGFNYTGPIDGHDLASLILILQTLQRQKGLQFLHIKTKKGQGYKLAEADPILYHGPSQFDPEKGVQKQPAKAPTFSQIFGHWLCDMGHQDTRLIGITPAMCEGSAMVDFAHQFPTRFFDVGIAEQHSVTFAGGLACDGLKPVVAIYSTFLQRAYDQVIHDIALQNLDVTFALDRAGIVGADGATHAGNYDIAYLRCIPNMVLTCPSNEAEMRLLLTTAYQYPGPAAVRYPRGTGGGVVPDQALTTVPIGRARRVQDGQNIAILAFGTLLTEAQVVADKYQYGLFDMRFIKPLDTALLDELCQQYDGFVTLEDGCLAGGAGSAVVQYLAQQKAPQPVLQLGYPDIFIDHGEQKQLHARLGLDVQGIEQSILQFFDIQS